MDKQVRQPDRQTDGQEKTDKTETDKTDKWMDKTRQTDIGTIIQAKTRQDRWIDKTDKRDRNKTDKWTDKGTG